MILSCNHISKSFVTGDVLNDCSFHIEDREKAAIIGLNGAGKSTLLKIITGELTADSGEVTIAKNKKLGYLAQYQDIDTDSTIIEEMYKTKENLIRTEERLRELEHEMKKTDGEELKNLMDRYIALFCVLKNFFYARTGFCVFNMRFCSVCRT